MLMRLRRWVCNLICAVLGCKPTTLVEVSLQTHRHPARRVNFGKIARL